MTLVNTTLRPGLLVGLKTAVRGGVKYDRVDLENDENVSKWTTTRTIDDPAEHERAVKARQQARQVITRVCSDTDFGLLCLQSNADLLEAAIEEARRIADEFNSTATRTRLSIRAITGTVAQDDARAIKEINGEIRSLIDDLASGVQNLDVDLIRETASRAANVSKVLTPSAQASVQIAIDTARQNANAVAKKIRDDGEAALIEIDALAIRQIRDQRTAFLDLSEPVEIRTPEAQGRVVELTRRCKHADETTA